MLIRNNEGVPTPQSDTPEKSLWTRKVEAEPQHSTWFLQRFRDMRAAGKDIEGEARFVDAIAPRGARILDAGCGSGRTGGPLSGLGHRVVGVDVDPVLIAAAREDFPAATWLVGDLAELSLAGLPLTGSSNQAAATIEHGAAAAPFDLIVAAGNVLPFLAPSTRQRTLANLRAVLAPGGRMALGFGAGRGYRFEDFYTDAAASGWEIQLRFRGWNLLPFDADSDFLVAVLAPTAPGRNAGTVTAGTEDAAKAGAQGAATGAVASPVIAAGSVPFGRLEAQLNDGPGSDPMGGNTLRPMI